MANRKKKINLALIFGGRSGEHEVSVSSATSVALALDSHKYEVLPVYVDKKGRWALEKGFPDREGVSLPVILSVIPGQRALLDRKTGKKVASVDVVLPLIHGTYGEDGCLQGLLEIADLPYCGCEVLGSSVGMDKAIQKTIWRQTGINVVPWVEMSSDEWIKDTKRIVREIGKLGYPVFVKPANSGSSVGISRVNRPKDLQNAIEEAFSYDLKVIVEKGIDNAREIEVSVIGPNDDPIASVPGEVIPSNDFYDYASKYLDGKSDLLIPAHISAKEASSIQDIAIRAYRAVGGMGFARVDFLIGRDGGKVYLNEINTLPGFTEFSMFPKLWEASGIGYRQLLDKIISLAIERHAAKSCLSREFVGKGGKRK